MHCHQLRRREFITLVAGAAAWPVAAHGQQPAMPVIGMLLSGWRGSSDRTLRAFPPWNDPASERGPFEHRQNSVIFWRSIFVSIPRRLGSGSTCCRLRLAA